MHFFYAHMLAVAEEMRAEIVADLDPRLRHDYADHLNKDDKTAVNKAAQVPGLASFDERIASLKAGEPQLISRAGLPAEVCEGIAWPQDGPPWTSTTTGTARASWYGSTPMIGSSWDRRTARVNASMRSSGLAIP